MSNNLELLRLRTRAILAQDDGIGSLIVLRHLFFFGVFVSFFFS